MKAVKIILLILLALILGSVAYAFALVNGKVPLPRAAVETLAEKAGMPAGEQIQLEKALNVYEIIRRSPASGQINDLRKAAMRGASKEETARSLNRIYRSLPDSTLEEIRDELEIAPADFGQVTTILDKAMDSFEKTGQAALSEEDRQTLKDLADKYGYSKFLDEASEGQF